MLFRFTTLIALIILIVSCQPGDAPLEDFDQVNLDETGVFSVDDLEIGSIEELVAISDNQFIALDRTANRLHLIDSEGNTENLRLDIPSGSDITSIGTDRSGNFYVMNSYSGKVHRLEEDEPGYWKTNLEISFQDDISEMPRKLGVSDDYVFVKTFIQGQPDEDYSEGKLYAFNHDGDLLNPDPVSFPMQNLTRDPLRQSGMPIPIPFSNTTVFAAGNDGSAWLGWTENAELRSYSPDGQRRAELEYHLQPAASDMSELEEWLETMDPELRNTIEASLPEYLPVMHNILVSDDDEIWIRMMAEGTSSNIIVFNQEGDPQKQLQVPGDFELHDVIGNTIVGVKQDPTGEETLRIFSMDE